MKIKVDVFRSEEDRNSNSSLWHAFKMSIDVPYPFPAVGDEFSKALKGKAHDEVLKKLYGKDYSQEAGEPSPAGETSSQGAEDDSHGAIPVNIACEAKDWDCKEKLFTLKLEFPGRHAAIDYKNGSITDYSRPNEIFYLKGTIEQ